MTGWPVTPNLDGYWGNHWEAKNLTYYSFLYFHYLIGAMFFTFGILGLVRNVIWKDSNGNNKQIIFLLAYSVLVASIFAVVLVYQYAPDEEDEESSSTSFDSNNNNNNTIATNTDNNKTYGDDNTLNR